MCFVFEICSLPETFTCIEWAANLFVILSSNVWIICQFHSQPVFTEINYFCNIFYNDARYVSESLLFEREMLKCYFCDDYCYNLFMN